MNIEEYWLWVNEGLDLTDYSINDRLPKVMTKLIRDASCTDLANMSSQDPRYETEHGVDLGEYDPQRHPQIGPSRHT